MERKKKSKLVRHYVSKFVTFRQIALTSFFFISDSGFERLQQYLPSQTNFHGIACLANVQSPFGKPQTYQKLSLRNLIGCHKNMENWCLE